VGEDKDEMVTSPLAFRGAFPPLPFLPRRFWWGSAGGGSRWGREDLLGLPVSDHGSVTIHEVEQLQHINFLFFFLLFLNIEDLW
jgi:hypothetical protein